MLPKLLCSDLFGHLLYSDYAKNDMQINISADRERLKVAYQTSKGKISSVLDHHRGNPQQEVHIPTEQLLCLEIDTIKCKQTEQQTVDASISVNNQRANMLKLTVSTTVTACLNIQKVNHGCNARIFTSHQADYIQSKCSVRVLG